MTDEKQVQQLWNTLDQLRHQRHWESEGKHLLSKALADARRAALEEAAEIADEHRCGGEDDIVCQHWNCNSLIAAAICQRASEGV